MELTNAVIGNVLEVSRRYWPELAEVDITIDESAVLTISNGTLTLLFDSGGDLSGVRSEGIRDR